MMRHLLFSALLFSSSLFAAEVLLKDDFANPKLETRRASRGEWKFADSIATCTQDDELYKKLKNHGPIIFYDLGYEDATIRFSYKADAGVKSLVFTSNGAEGHIFRFVTGPKSTGIRAFPSDSKDHKSISLGTEGPALKPGAWVPVVVTLKGTKATVKIGDFEQTYEHASLARPKTNLSIGFSFGTVSLKDVVVEK